jgi:hypothetical protein
MKNILVYGACLILILALIPLDLARMGLEKVLIGGEVK